MPATITLTGDYTISLGSTAMTFGTGNLGAYVNTGGNHGVAVTPTAFGLGVITNLVIDPAGGYNFVYVPSTGRIKAYGNGGVAAHAHDLLIKGGQAAASTAATAYYATDILGKEAITDKTIAGSASATKGGVVATSVTSSGGNEVLDAVSLTSAVFNWRCFGY